MIEIEITNNKYTTSLYRLSRVEVKLIEERLTHYRVEANVLELEEINIEEYNKTITKPTTVFYIDKEEDIKIYSDNIEKGKVRSIDYSRVAI